MSGAEEGEVVVVASQLRGYGVWDGSVARDGSLLACCKGPAPSLLFLWVTDAQANLLQMELSAIQTSATTSGKQLKHIIYTSEGDVKKEGSLTLMLFVLLKECGMKAERRWSKMLG